MLIEELKQYPRLHQRAVENFRAYRGYTPDADSTVDDFMWDETEEGHRFWSYVHSENFAKAYLYEPTLFQGRETFTNCFGVEIDAKTGMRADSDGLVDFTNKRMRDLPH